MKANEPLSYHTQDTCFGDANGKPNYPLDRRQAQAG